ncbi:hypothetical protein SDC9_64406 [bioreactor metagenome]|uniref:Uncharacterized protein n=1 Tax=bioreactor metagenome TaxID=1076179 RepID=A0A644XPE1_9ZZZZ
MSLEEGHVLGCGAACGKTGGGFDIVRPGFGDDFAHFDFFFLGKQAGLYDDLQNTPGAALFQGADLFQHSIPPLFLHHTDIDDHINLVGAVPDGFLGFKDLDCGGLVAVGESDDGTDFKIVPNIILSPLHKGRRDAHRGSAVGNAVVAELFDLEPGGLLFQQGMIAFGEDVLSIHGNDPFHISQLLCHKRGAFRDVWHHRRFRPQGGSRLRHKPGITAVSDCYTA